MATPDFTIADVLAWARTKPADGWYDYVDGSNCAMCQFLRETGRLKAPAVGGNLSSRGAAIYDADTGLQAGYIPAHIASAAAARGRTFGALAKRLEALCPETPVNASAWAAIDAYMNDLELVNS